MNIDGYNPYKKGFDMLVADIEAHESKEIPYEERLQYAMDTALEIQRLRAIEVAAVACAEDGQWGGEAFYELMCELQKALRGDQGHV